MESKNLLIVFVRNPELGKVKTRLAKTIGDEKALEIYLDLLKYTNNVTSKCSVDKAVFYSHFVDNYDNWNNLRYQKQKQEGETLGDRMRNAFDVAFKKGYENVILIGSDCIELSIEVLEKAFYVLTKLDVVIGPAKDGGYYLLGMKKIHAEFFVNKKWSTENVLLDTLVDVKKLKLTHQLLVALSDIDTEEDWNNRKGETEWG